MEFSKSSYRIEAMVYGTTTDIDAKPAVKNF
jgi:hypothetical protein